VRSSSGIIRQYINSKLLKNITVYDKYDDYYIGRDVAQAVSGRSLNADARIQF